MTATQILDRYAALGLPQKPDDLLLGGSNLPSRG
jgi:hypothetical protein